jgi:hypothetical protein
MYTRYTSTIVIHCFTNHPGLVNRICTNNILTSNYYTTFLYTTVFANFLHHQQFCGTFD